MANCVFYLMTSIRIKVLLVWIRTKNEGYELVTIWSYMIYEINFYIPKEFLRALLQKLFPNKH